RPKDNQENFERRASSTRRGIDVVLFRSDRLGICQRTVWANRRLDAAYIRGWHHRMNDHRRRRLREARDPKYLATFFAANVLSFQGVAKLVRGVTGWTSDLNCHGGFHSRHSDRVFRFYKLNWSGTSRERQVWRVARRTAWRGFRDEGSGPSPGHPEGTCGRCRPPASHARGRVKRHLCPSGAHERELQWLGNL